MFFADSCHLTVQGEYQHSYIHSPVWGANLRADCARFRHAYMTEVITTEAEEARQAVKERKGTDHEKALSSVPCAPAPRGHVKIQQQQDTRDGFHNHTFHL